MNDGPSPATWDQLDKVIMRAMHLRLLAWADIIACQVSCQGTMWTVGLRPTTVGLRPTDDMMVQPDVVVEGDHGSGAASPEVARK